MSSLRPRDMLGQVVGNGLALFELIGSGGMGAVYKAHRLGDDAVVAVKVMHSGMNPVLRRRFEREVRAACAVRHPGSVQVFESGTTTDGTPFLVMELLDGRDLGRMLYEDWPLSDARIADLVIELLDVLVHAHGLGIIHRDLKPENILVVRDEDGRARLKVCDFGLAKIFDPYGSAPADRWETHQGQALGTPEYMSPEQSWGDPTDARADIYAVGVLLYQMLTGRVPFSALTPVAMAVLHLTQQVAPPRTVAPGVDARLDAICTRALAKNPDDRFATAEDMRREIVRIRPQLCATPVARGSLSPESLSELVYPPSSVRPTRADRPMDIIVDAASSLRPRSSRHESMGANRSKGSPAIVRIVRRANTR